MICGTGLTLEYPVPRRSCEHDDEGTDTVVAGKDVRNSATVAAMRRTRFMF